MTTLIAKLAGAAFTLIAILAVVAVGAVLFVTVMMPFVFPFFLVGVALVTRRLSRRAATPRVVKDLPPANTTAAAAGADSALAA